MLGQQRPSVDWYRKTDNINAVVSELDDAEDGSFLALRGSKPNRFRLVVRLDNETHIFAIIDEGVGEGLHLAESSEMFATLADLIEFYQTPASLSTKDLPCLLMDARTFQVAYNSVSHRDPAVSLLPSRLCYHRGPMAHLLAAIEPRHPQPCA